jgi:hypothetical protein
VSRGWGGPRNSAETRSEHIRASFELVASLERVADVMGTTLHAPLFEGAKQRRFPAESLSTAGRSEVEHHNIFVGIVEKPKDAMAAAAVFNAETLKLIERPLPTVEVSGSKPCDQVHVSSSLRVSP